MHANRPDLLENGVLILHDNARPNLGKDVRELLDGYSWEVLRYVDDQRHVEVVLPMKKALPDSLNTRKSVASEARKKYLAPAKKLTTICPLPTL